MGILDSLKNFFNGEEEYVGEYEDDEEVEQDEQYEEEEQFEDFPPRQSRRRHEREYEDYDSGSDDEVDGKGNKIVSISTTTKLKVVISKPVELAEATAIADNIMDKYTVIINLEGATKETGNKIILFLQGVAYALDAKFKGIANNTYIITPFGVGLVDNGIDFLGELESNGIFF